MTLFLGTDFDILPFPWVISLLSFIGSDLLRGKNILLVVHLGLLGFIETFLRYLDQSIRAYSGLMHVTLNDLFLIVSWTRFD